MKKSKRDEKLVLVRETLIGLPPGALEAVQGAAAAANSAVKVCILGSLVRACLF
jgi:hypothetical protein